ncbi:MAG: sulfotransferase [Anaerolineae bacterium]|jgi:hypothetical protein
MKTPTPAEIQALASALDSALPEFRVAGRPPPELLEAAHRWSEAVWAAAEAAGPFPLALADRERGCRLACHPVFICGLHRSGTTLVRDMLDGHPQLGVLPSEGSFLTSLQSRMERLPPAERLPFLGREWLYRLVNPSNQAPFWLLGQAGGRQSPYLLFARLLLAWWSELQTGAVADLLLRPLVSVALAYISALRHGRVDAHLRYWTEKTPTNEFHLHQLWVDFPEAKVIHVLRDPLSIYASRKQLDRQVFGAFRSRRRLLRDLARSFEIAVEHSYDPRYHLVRYEQLVQNPAPVMERLAIFLDIEHHDSLLRPTLVSMPSFANSSFAAPRRSGAILPAAAHHRGTLTALERQLIAAHAGHGASRLGYPTERLGAIRSLLLKTGFRLWPAP